MALSQDKQPDLLKLPAEIRYEIDGLVVLGHEPSFIFTLTHVKRRKFVLVFTRPQQPNVARTCRQLRGEVLAVFYGRAPVTFDTTQSIYTARPGWWRHTPAWKVAEKYVTQIDISDAYKLTKGSMLVTTAEGKVGIEIDSHLDTQCFCRVHKMAEKLNRLQVEHEGQRVLTVMLQRLKSNVVHELTGKKCNPVTS